MTKAGSQAKRRDHVYLRKILTLQASGQVPPGISDVDIVHDSWCGIFHGRECNCNPTITVRPQKDGKGYEHTI